MRTTVDLPVGAHRRASELAKQQGRSLSAVLADLVVRGLAGQGDPVSVEIDELTSLPVLRIGRALSAAEAAEMIDDDDAHG